MKELKKVHVVCIKWGSLFSANDVNRLKKMILFNTTYDICFHCFTDDKKGLDNDINSQPIPQIKVEPKGCFKRETALFSDNLGGLIGKRVFYFDLDVLIIKNLDEFFDYPKDDKFYIINDWASKGNNVGQGSCFSWIISKKYNDISTDYEIKKEEIDKKFGTASQEYISEKIIEKQNYLKFWPNNWFCSFRFHCLPHPFLRYFVAPNIPNMPNLKVIVFHGNPSINDAYNGIWIDKKKHRWKIWKKIYKHVRPTKWIDKYWINE